MLNKQNFRLTTIDLLTFAAADNTPDRFLHAAVEDIQSFIVKVIRTISSGSLRFDEILVPKPK